MKKLFTVLMFSVAAFAYAQQNTPQKFALVIGNADYSGISKLRNPVKDANDVAAALQALGFTVDKVLDGNLDRMETAAENLKRRLGASRNTYGFFFYAGHGVQSGGDNYLIPVDANNIQTENHLRQRAFSVQTLLDNLNDAGNELNMIVLDACRDNPFGWARSGSRGLSVVGRVPAGSIVMYATSANSTANDGAPGGNGLFTGQLLNNLKTPGLSVRDLFDKTGEDVLRVSEGRQHPELSLRFFGASTAYLGTRPAPATVTPPVTPAVTPVTPPAQPDTASAKTYFDRGETFRNRSEWDAAIREYTEAIRINPNYAEAYFGRGIAYSEGKRDYDRAIADCTEAIRLNPGFVEAYINRGIAYRAKGDYDRAIADYNEAIRLNPNFALAYNNRGFAYLYKRDYDRAISDCTEAIRLNPNADFAYHNRGIAYFNGKRDNDRAIADFTEAIRLNPNNAAYYNARGLAYRAKGDTARADADLARARELGYTP